MDDVVSDKVAVFVNDLALGPSEAQPLQAKLQADDNVRSLLHGFKPVQEALTGLVCYSAQWALGVGSVDQSPVDEEVVDINWCVARLLL